MVVIIAMAFGAAVLEAWLRGEPGVLRAVAGLVVQQRRRTLAGDRLLTLLGVVGVALAATLAGAVLPIQGPAVLDSSVGIVWFNAMEVGVWVAVWLVGWGVNAVFPLVGGYRFVAQGLAYELPHMFALITVALGAGSLRFADIVAAQRPVWFVVWMPVAFLVYLLSALAMAFWGPFGEALGRDIAGGVAGELGGVDRLVFSGGRYLMLAVSAAAAVPLFLGADWAPAKTALVLAGLVLVRQLVPGVRMDRYMTFAWMVLIPATLVQMLIVGIVVL